MKLKPKKRIIKKAAELFYLRGFPNTHVGDIIEESHTYKKSFYQYFRDKNDLALEYLNFQEERILRNSRKLSEKFDSLDEFIVHWMNFNRKLFQGLRFAGCPFANFSIQTLRDKHLFEERIQSFVKNWEETLIVFIKRLQSDGKLNPYSDPGKIAKKIILIYEGSVHTFLMSKDMSYLDLAEEEMLQISKFNEQ